MSEQRKISECKFLNALSASSYCLCIVPMWNKCLLHICLARLGANGVTSCEHLYPISESAANLMIETQNLF